MSESTEATDVQAAPQLDPFAAFRVQIERVIAGFIGAVNAVGEQLLREFNAGLAELRRVGERAAEALRRALAPAPPLALPPLAAHLRRLHWIDIARRHAERPPARASWSRRRFGLACRQRKGLT